MNSSIMLDKIKINNKFHSFYYNVYTNEIFVVYFNNHEKVIESYIDFFFKLSPSDFSYASYLKEYLIYIKKLIHQRLLCKPMKTEALTEEEYLKLEEALNKNHYLNSDQKEWLKSFKSLLINKPLDISMIYYRYATLKIREDDLIDGNGSYHSLYNEIITAMKLPENLYKHALRHEGIHAHQILITNIYSDFFVEGITELIAREYEEYDENDYALLSNYDQETLVCKILCELFGKERVKANLMNFKFTEFCQLLKEKLTDKQIYQLLLWTSLYEIDKKNSDINFSALLAKVYYLLYDEIGKKYNSHNSENLQNIRNYISEATTGKRRCKKKYFINN